MGYMLVSCIIVVAVIAAIAGARYHRGPDRWGQVNLRTGMVDFNCKRCGFTTSASVAELCCRGHGGQILFTHATCPRCGGLQRIV